jgi:hypothetical protein
MSFECSIAKHNSIRLYGKIKEIRIADAADQARIYSWSTFESYDNANAIGPISSYGSHGAWGCISSRLSVMISQLFQRIYNK